VDSYARGSEWRLWDLHLHTPASGKDYDYGDATPENIVSILIENDIAAVAVTDHHTIDIEQYVQIRQCAAGKLTVFPGIELTTKLMGHDHIHLIGIFPDNLNTPDLESILTDLQSRLKFRPSDVKGKNLTEVSVRYEDSIKVIQKNGGLVSIHAGRKDKGIEKYPHALPVERIAKLDMVERIDIFEIGQSRDADDYRSKVFPNIPREYPMVICSDNHDIRKYTLREKCWIKADPTFLGLKQALKEHKDRIYLGPTPEQVASADLRSTRVIDSVSLSPTGSYEGKPWFDQELPLSPGLIAIIGRKGSGKSALADIIALAGSADTPAPSYSFLTDQRFRKEKLATNYVATIGWRDGTFSGEANLMNPVGRSAASRVRYLPQNYVETICNEAGITVEFQREINKVVFSRVRSEEKMDTTYLEELIDIHSSALDKDIDTIRSKIRSQIERLVNFEKKTSASYIGLLRDKLKEKERELQTIAYPKEVLEPPPDADQDNHTKLAGVVAAIKGLDERIQKAEDRLTGVNRKLQALEQLRTRLNSLEGEVADLQEEMSENCMLLGISFTDLITLSVTRTPLEQAELALRQEKALLHKELGHPPVADHFIRKDGALALPAERKKLSTVAEQLRAKLGAPQREYEEYQKARAGIDNRRAKVIGNAGDRGLESITSLKEELSYVEQGLGPDIEAALGQLFALTESLFKQIAQKQSIYSDIYEPIQRFIEQSTGDAVAAGCKLTFNVNIKCKLNYLQDEFLSLIDSRQSGSFRGDQEARKAVANLLAKNAVSDFADLKSFLIDTLHELRGSTSDLHGRWDTLSSQILKRASVADIYVLLFELSYLEVSPTIEFNGKDLNSGQLSPGEKGAVLLIFYLHIDREQCPLIIDQPEENLDNESVFSVLVPFMQEAKKRRQVIMVTHNPNLAVVCDADQIIHAIMDTNAKCKIRYSSGSVENPRINKCLVDVLEGTMPAFSSRRATYHPE